MRMKSHMMAALAAGLLMSPDPTQSHSNIPSRPVSVSKPATLSKKEWKKRKRRISIAKASRKRNRA